MMMKPAVLAGPAFFLFSLCATAPGIGHAAGDAQTSGTAEAEPPHAAASAAAATRRSGSPTPYAPPVQVPSAAGRIAPLQLPAPTVRIDLPDRPALTSSCDANGCWDTSGRRYNNVGPNLMRPDGRLCQNVAGVVSCP